MLRFCIVPDVLTAPPAWQLGIAEHREDAAGVVTVMPARPCTLEELNQALDILNGARTLIDATIEAGEALKELKAACENEPEQPEPLAGGSTPADLPQEGRS